jgi:lysozyme
MQELELLKARLRISEGLKLRMYLDTVGKRTIGYGHNLDAKAISLRAAEIILADDIQDALDDLDKFLPWWKTLDPIRQTVIADMSFNMGMGGLLTFRNTLRAIQEGRWRDASEGMLASKWARQTGQRAVKLARIMLTGEKEA